MRYQGQTCTTGSSLCSQNQGHGFGFFTGSSMPDGSIMVFTIVSDLNRDHECYGGYMRLIDTMTMQDSTGTVWRRVQ